MSNTRYQAEIDQIKAGEWSQLLARFDDANLYQTWSYGAVHWNEAELSHLVLKRAGEVVAMAQLRIVRPRFSKGGVAYLRWGPLCQMRGTALDPEVVQNMASALHAEYVQKRRLFLRILPNAFAGSERAKVFQAAFPQFKLAAQTAANTDRTFIVDISAPLEAVRKKFDQKWRNQLNRAEKNNLTIIEGSGEAEYKMFLGIYEKMWGRKQFETTVDVNEFARLGTHLPEGLKFKILICQHQGVPVSGMVASSMGHTGIYLLGATFDEGLNTKGAYLLHWTMIQRLKAEGVRYYDLGGIDPEKNPGVYHFKRGFSGDDVTRITPLEACEDIISAVTVRGAEFARGGLRRAAGKLKKGIAGVISRPKPVEKTPEAAPANVNL